MRAPNLALTLLYDRSIGADISWSETPRRPSEFDQQGELHITGGEPLAAGAVVEVAVDGKPTAFRVLEARGEGRYLVRRIPPEAPVPVDVDPWASLRADQDGEPR